MNPTIQPLTHEDAATSTLLMLNFQGMSPSATSKSRWKIPFFLDEHITNSNRKIPWISGTESWLKPHITDAQVAIPNYTVVRSDRIKSDRGGTILYIYEDIPISNVGRYDDDSCGAVICTLDSLKTITASIYRPPSSSSESFKLCMQFIQKYINTQTANKHYDIMLMGDFNLPSISWSTVNITSFQDEEGYAEVTKCSEILLNFMAVNFLTQCIDHPTRVHNTLDLVLTNNSNSIIHTSAEKTPLSDHMLVTIEAKLKNDHKSDTASNKPKPHTFRNLKLHDAEYEPINKHLGEIDWDLLRSMCTPEEFPELLYLTVLQVCELYCETKKVTNTSQLSRERRVLKRKRVRLKAKLEFLKVNNPKSKSVIEIRNEIYSIEEKIKQTIFDQQKMREEKAIQTMKKNPAYFFSFAKRSDKSNCKVGPLYDENKKLQSDHKKMANLLQEQYTRVFSDPNSPDKKFRNHNIECQDTLNDIEFTQDDIIAAINEISENSACGEQDIPAIVLKKCKDALSYPILCIWKESMQTGKIPQKYKYQSITPIHKKDSKAIPANYRPISLTSHIIKIFERVMRNRIVKHLEANHLLFCNQHGFRPQRSCFTQLLAHFDMILHSLLNNEDVDVVYLDFEKAFDKVDHQILLNKLKQYNIGGKLYNWLCDYLSNRRQAVVIQGTKSYEANVQSGVPQGTVLGPLLFLVYINDLGTSIEDCIVSCFADDTRLKRKVANEEDKNILQNAVNHSAMWSKDNNMSLHEHKFELVTHSLNKKPASDLPFANEYFTYETRSGELIEASSVVKDLGINVSCDSTWTPQINIMCDKARQMCSWVLSVFSDRSATVMLTLYNSMIRSRLEYCSPLWSPSKITDIQTIEGVQRHFTSRISGCADLSYWERLQKLRISSLQRRRERYIIITMFKVLNGLMPNDLNITFSSSERRGIRALVPALTRGATAKAQRMFDDSFAVMGPRLWNCIPAATTRISKLSTFKTSLGRFLDQLPDRPPTVGYPSIHNNSILSFAVRSQPSGR